MLHYLSDINVTSSHIAATIQTHKENKLFSLPIVEDFLHQPISPPWSYEMLVRSPQRSSIRDTSTLVLLTVSENPHTFFFLSKCVGQVNKENKWKNPHQAYSCFLPEKGHDENRKITWIKNTWHFLPDMLCPIIQITFNLIAKGSRIAAATHTLPACQAEEN